MEALIKHAYLIMTYDNYEQLEKLIKTLDDERNDIFVHIDKKSKDFTEEIKKRLIGGMRKSRIEVYNEIAVYWSHYSQVECELFLLEKATKKGHFAYYHLLSGQCFPIKNQNYIHDFFEQNNGKEFIDYQKSFFDKHSNIIMKRVEYYHLFRRYCRLFKSSWINSLFRGLNLLCVDIQKLVRVSRCKANNIDICYGANWFSVTDDFARYVLDKRAFIEKIFKYTNCPDEIFMQTLLKASPYFENLYKETSDDFYGNMRLVDFSRGNPYVYRKSDIEEIRNSKYVFVRKVDERVEPGILELITKECNLAI